MKLKIFIVGLCLGLSSIVPAATAQQPQLPQASNQPLIEGTWSDEFAVYNRSELNDYPLRPIEWNNTLYSGMYHHGVAEWNGKQWLQIGNLEGRVIAITWHQNKLYAYGKLNLAGTPVSMAYWDGATWTAMSNQFSYHTSVTLASYNDQLYLAGGHALTLDGQTIEHLARWDGTQWHDTDLGVQGMILTMLVRPDGLYVGGTLFPEKGQRQGVMRWDGSQWHEVGSPLTGLVLDLEWANDQLYVGGLFTSTLNPAINNIAAWNGTSWDSFGNGIADARNRNVHGMAVLDDTLYVMTRFDNSSNNHLLQRWNGNAWVSLATTYAPHYVEDILRYPDVVLLNYQDRLLAFGSISFPYPSPTQLNQGTMALAWNGTHWESMTPNGLVVKDRDQQPTMLATSGETVYTAGSNLYWGNGQASLAQFAAGQTWQTVLPPNLLGWYSAFEAETYQTELFANIESGLFRVVSGTVELLSTAQIHSLAQANNRLYVAGDFEQFNGVTAHNLVIWDGTAWQALNAPASFDRVTIVEVYGNHVYISDGSQVAHWNGSQWQTLATGVNRITSIEPSASGLYVAGTFSSIDGVNAEKIAAWNGSAWSALTGVINGPINDLELGRDGLYVAGSFSGISNGVVSPGILRWNGVWQSVGGGVQYRYTPQIPINVTHLAATPTRMYAVGSFDSVGNRYESAKIAAWNYGSTPLIIASPDHATTYRPQAVSVDVLANDWTIDNELLQLTDVISTSNGTATISGTKLLFTPNADFQGTTTVGYRVRNPLRNTFTTGYVTIDVQNHMPTPSPMTLSVQPNSTTTIDVLAGLIDLNNDQLTITHASVTAGSVDIIDNQLRYGAPDRARLSVTISYTISDGHGGSSVATIVVNSGNYQLFLPYTNK
ncbi:Ig-like domain-containing protein [Herpetosiphon llansteffanensis]